VKTKTKTDNGSATLDTDLDLQHKYVERLKQGGDKSFALIAADAFVRGMRDSGYKSTATAIDEFMDNAIQAQATRVDVVYTVQKAKGGQSEISSIAVVDDGHGMEPDMIRAAVLWGGTHREDDRRGFGRYGFGLPSAAVSITDHFEVYSRVKGEDWYRVRIDLREICDGKLTNSQGLVIAPKAEKVPLPKIVAAQLGKRTLEQGTIILLEAPDRLTSGFRKPTTFHSNLMEHLGLVYRGLLNRCAIHVNDKKVDPVDPLFLDPSARFYDVGNNILAEGRDRLVFDVNGHDGKVGQVRLRFSYMPPGFQNGPEKQLNERFGVMKDNNAYLIVTRAGRQIDLAMRPHYAGDKYDMTIVNYDRNWAVELDFDPILDEEFGITVNKQQVTISERMWQILEAQGVPLIIEKDLRQRFNKERNDKKARDSADETRTSESIMTEAEKFQPKSIDISAEKEEKANQRLLQDAEKRADEAKRPKEEIVNEILAEANARKYEVRFESLEGAPFFRTQQYGPQKRLFVNTRHRFYSDLYSGAESTARVKTALELLIFAIGSCELEASGDREIFYRQERRLWSDRLDIALELLDRRDSVQDADSARTEQSEQPQLAFTQA
jgi:hypothetical protein